MKKAFFLWLWFIGMWVTPDCRGQHKQNTLTLSRTDSLHQASCVTIGLFGALTGAFQPVAEIDLNESKPTATFFRLSTPQFAFVRFGDELHPLFVKPGEQLRLHLGLTGNEVTLNFAGQGAEANTYLAQAYRMQRRFEKGLFVLPLPDAFRRLDSLDNALRLLDQTYAQRKLITQEVLALLRKRSQIRTLSFKLNFLLSRYGGGRDTTVISLLSQTTQQVPFDSTLLVAHLPDYLRLLGYYRSALLMLNLSSRFTKEELTANRSSLPLITDEEIKKWNLPLPFTEYIRANNLSERIDQHGITTATSTVFDAYRKRYPRSLYLPELQKGYDRWLVLKSGQKAPDFTGITPEGKRLSLSDLKGKVVYMDVWATWCLPCRVEFPHAKKLQQTFLPTDEVAFLYVSIDKDEAAWKRIVNAGVAPSGYHINGFDQKQSDQFAQSYLIGSIPRYILVDKLGNIVNPEAPKPSSKDIEMAIKALLK
ncbi:redoxin family protein [Rudanella paleaurantiibacter]|uniref:Redoxin family protein n=1 Tax=Rudanella paleaurantiibacter TaxID=2614655 RepID=A0A7J5U160_9BACT|nr:TlpA disulfide reductase family protein [Rudanella paleaurantiibacter]KAB7731370.1 redoxin family protein [Rudanella paleaurantiibacter]